MRATIDVTKRTPKRIDNIAMAGNQNGASTHHQDHEITPHNFNTMKAIPSNPNIGHVTTYFSFII